MKNNKRADTIAWIIIAVFILSFAMLGIVNVLDYNQSVSDNYEKETDLYILKSNSDNILKRLNIDGIQENEKFYVFKDKTTNEYKVMTWSTNEKYKYVDKDGNNVDPTNAVWKTFTREFTKKIDILRYDIKPPEISNRIFHFDATNINWLNNSNSWIVDEQTISVWKDIATSNWEQNAVDKDILPDTTKYTSQLPTYNEKWLNWMPMVEFNWVDQQLAMNLHQDINNDWDCNAQKYFKEKSFAIVFKTWDDIENAQMIYEQWWAATWYNFMIEDWDVWAWVHNISNKTGYSCTTFNNPSDTNYYFEWDSWHKYKSVRLWEVRPNTIYFVMVVQDSTHIVRTHANEIDDIKQNLTTHDKYIDSQNRLKIYLNGNLVNETDHVDPQPEHSYWALWNIYRWNVSTAEYLKWNDPVIDDVNTSEKAYFKWWIWELISWNHALTENEIRWIQNYFSQKWLWGKRSIRYDIVETDIKEFKQY